MAANKNDQTVSFLNHRATPAQNTVTSKATRRHEKRLVAENPVAQDYVPSLYSDRLIQGQRR